MKQKQIRKPFTLFLASVILMAVVMLVTLSIPAFADEGDGAPTRELRVTGLQWDENGQCYADEAALDMRNPDGDNGMNYAPGRGDCVIFFIWNNDTQRKEKFVVPEADGGLEVIPVDAEGIAPNAKQSQYYVQLAMESLEDAELTADGLTFHVTAAMDDFSFFSSQAFSQETYVGRFGRVNEENLTDCTVYFGNSYAEDSEPHDKVVSVEKLENGDANLYTVEKVNDDCWKIEYKDVVAVWGSIMVDLKLEILQPDGETREEVCGLWIYHEYPPELQFVYLNGEWNDAEGRDVYYFNPEETHYTSNLEMQPGYPEYGILGYGAEWTENGLSFENFTPVSAKNLRFPAGITVDTNVPAAEGAQWADYYVALSVERTNVSVSTTYRGYTLNIASRLPDIGVYSAPEATWENWLGRWGFPFNAVWDNTYYVISTASDGQHGRHLTDMALSTEWDKENEEIANGAAQLTKVGDGVYNLTLDASAVKGSYCHLELDFSWMDVAGNTYTDINRYLGDFNIKSAVVAADAPLFDGTADSEARFIPTADAKNKVADSVTIKAGEEKVLYLYRSAFSGSSGAVVGSYAFKGYFHSASEELTLTQDAADFSKFTLSADKTGVYEIYIGVIQPDFSSVEMFHSDGTPYTAEERLQFEYDIAWTIVKNDEGEWNLVGTIVPEAGPVNFGDMIPIEELLDGDYGTFEMTPNDDWGDARLTVIVEPSYTDVATGDWFYNDVNYVTLNGMMTGDGQAFNPSGSVKREMVPTVLYRLEGQPTVKAGSFSDVADGIWYASATAWGAENGIILGVGDDAFGVGTDITRETLAIMLYRYAKYKGCDMTASDDLSSFNDADSVHSWALKEMQWAVGAGIITGKGANIDPQGTATRAELAAMLARFHRDVL